jgi:tetratricopeptide (TPR) repeat protein
MPPGLAHALKWAAFTVPVVLLGLMEPAARASIFDRTEALAAALPENPLVQKKLGTALEEANRDEEAIAAYRRALELGIQSAATEYSVGALLARRGELDEALLHLKAFLARRETGAAHAKIASIRLARGETDTAILGFETALAPAPDLAEAHHGLGQALTARSDLDGVVSHYRQAVRLDPDSAASLFNLAAILARSGETHEAIRLYREVLRLDPKLTATRDELERLGSPASTP